MPIGSAKLAFLLKSSTNPDRLRLQIDDALRLHSGLGEFVGVYQDGSCERCGDIQFYERGLVVSSREKILILNYTDEFQVDSQFNGGTPAHRDKNFVNELRFLTPVDVLTLTLHLAEFSATPDAFNLHSFILWNKKRIMRSKAKD